MDSWALYRLSYSGVVARVSRSADVFGKMALRGKSAVDNRMRGRVRSPARRAFTKNHSEGDGQPARIVRDRGGSLSYWWSGCCCQALASRILLDFRGFGTRLIRFSLYTNAAIWEKDARPTPEHVDSHRVMFGTGVTLVALVVVVSGTSGLARREVSRLAQRSRMAPDDSERDLTLEPAGPERARSSATCLKRNRLAQRPHPRTRAWAPRATQGPPLT